MFPLIEWSNALRTCFNFKLSSTDAALTVQSVVNNAQEKMKELTILYKNFEKAWNAFQRRSKTVEINQKILPDRKVVTLEPMNENQSILLSCVRLSHQGRAIPYMLHVLGELQNQFLLDVYSSGYGNREGTLRKGIQSVAASELIHYDRQKVLERMLPFMRAATTYGSGSLIEFDWSRIERVIDRVLLANSVLLNTALTERGAFEEFRFQHDIFKKDERNLFKRINDVVPQDRSALNMKSIRLDKFYRDQGFIASKFLPALEALLFVLQHQKPNPSLSEYSVIDFANFYLDQSTASVLQDCANSQSPLVSLKLSRVESLYDLLQDQICDTVLGCLDPKYNEAIDDKIKGVIVKLLVPVVGSMDAIIDSLRRFIVRYLRGTDGISASEPFYLYAEFVRWPAGVLEADVENALSDRVLQELLVGQIYQTVLFLVAKIEEAENAQQLPVQVQADVPPVSAPASKTAAISGGNAKARRRTDFKKAREFSY